MKVKELLKKVNGKTAKMPIFIEDINDTKTRRPAISFDFAGYYSEEQDKTVVDIELLADKVVVFYK